MSWWLLRNQRQKEKLKLLSCHKHLPIKLGMINQSLNLAFKYTEESVEKCKQLADFLKKRQEIEDEYAKSLSKHQWSIRHVNGLFRKVMQISFIETFKETKLVF